MKTLNSNKTRRFNVTRVSDGRAENFTMSGASIGLMLRAFKRTPSIEVAFNGSEISIYLPSSELHIKCHTGISLRKGPITTRFSLVSSIEAVLLDKVPQPVY